MRIQELKNSKLDLVSLKLPHNLVVQIDNLAKQEDRSRSSIIRRFLIKYMENYQDITPAHNNKTESSFVAASNKVFADEWEDKGDEKAFANLQKYAKKSINSL
jgi:metal-responsive CopG/Arc/MetJ family transcriptional regulator